MDFITALLSLVISVLTAVLLIFSYQIYLILQEFKKNLKDLDKILVNLGRLSSKIDDTISSASLVALSVKIIQALISQVHQKENGKRD